MQTPPCTRLPLFALTLLATLAAFPLQAQRAPLPDPVATSTSPAPILSKFDLTFPGGTPGELVAAIEKASGQPINVIIPAGHSRVQLPALRLKQVDIRQLFHVMGDATERSEVLPNGQVAETSYRFFTKDGPAIAAPLWYFRVQGYFPLSAAPTTRFYSLAPYLRQGVTVDDITTAIRIGWEMRGETEMPSLKFHKETQLLIVVGQPAQLEVINDVLKATQLTLSVRESNQPATPAP